MVSMILINHAVEQKMIERNDNTFNYDDLNIEIQMSRENFLFKHYISRSEQANLSSAIILSPGLQTQQPTHSASARSSPVPQN